MYEEFIRLLDYWENSAGRWDVMEDIITLRASFLIDRAITGLAIDFDQALAILRNHNDFTTEQQRQQRDILLAAIDNLVDFAVAEECSMLRELPSELSEEDLESCDDIFLRYNGAGAMQENEDVMYAGAMAAWWIAVSSETVITFHTQGDEKVRPWHEELEGLSYRKSEFPVELIPPIEWNCRCYLSADGFGSVMGRLSPLPKDVSVDPVFRESLATGGRIFSDAHPYFKTRIPNEAKMIAEKIKSKFYSQ